MMRDWVGLGLACGAVMVLAWGCTVEESASDDGEGGAGGMTSPMTVTVAAPSSTAATGGAGGVGDESTSCADALPLEEKNNDLGGIFFDYEGVLAEEGDVDYFSFEVVEGEWVSIRTDANGDDDPDLIDTVVTVYDADGDQIAANDDTSSSNPDSRIAWHATESGTYCMKVADVDDRGGPTFGYRAVVVPMAFEIYDFYTVDVEPNNTPQEPQTGIVYEESSTNQIYTDYAGLFDATDDVDVYEVVTPAAGVAFGLEFNPQYGSNGYGSTAELGPVAIYESNGTDMLAYLDPSKGADGFSQVPLVPESTYYVSVAAPPGTLGSNPFYYLDFYTRSSVNHQELNDAANAVPETADPVPVPTVDGNAKRHYIGGTLDTSGAGDTDWWEFQADAGGTVRIYCSSWRDGSGVRDATFGVYADPAGSALQEETEVEDAQVYWSTSSSASMDEVDIATDGTHYFKVTGSVQADGITSNHYVCGLHVYEP